MVFVFGVRELIFAIIIGLVVLVMLLSFVRRQIDRFITWRKRKSENQLNRE